jgi:pantothenate kinase-related protein Tda10
MLSPLSYKVDLDQLSQRSLGTCWMFDPILSWLEAGVEIGEAPRIICVLAGAGTGKSTISAAIWKEVWVIPHLVEVNSFPG